MSINYYFNQFSFNQSNHLLSKLHYSSPVLEAMELDPPTNPNDKMSTIKFVSKGPTSNYPTIALAPGEVNGSEADVADVAALEEQLLEEEIPKTVENDFKMLTGAM